MPAETTTPTTANCAEMETNNQSGAPVDCFPELDAGEVRSDPKLKTADQEVTLRFAQDEEVATVTSDIPSVTRDLLHHPEFTVEWVRVLRQNGRSATVSPDSYEEEEGPIVAAKGTAPIGTLKVLASSRSENWPALVVSNHHAGADD